MDKKPKFYCESCGTEVKQNDRFCPRCGRFFSSVKCPSCGLTGDSRMFKDGCPSCGYAVYGAGDTSGRDERKKNDQTDPLPWWVYLASVLLLAFLVAFILFRQ